MSSLNNQEVYALLQKYCEDLGLDLVHFTVNRVSQEIQIDVLADRPQGGISIDECGKLNKHLCDALDEQALFPEGYTVKVSSPGVDRPLHQSQDFQRVVGRPVRFYLSEKFADKLEHVGTVEDATDTEVVITKNKTESLRIPLTIINKAMQEI